MLLFLSVLLFDDDVMVILVKLEFDFNSEMILFVCLCVDWIFLFVGFGGKLIRMWFKWYLVWVVFCCFIRLIKVLIFWGVI